MADLTANRSVLARQMYLDAHAAQLLASLQSAGLLVVLLKGPVTARWLYPVKAERPYSDIDLYVGPGDWSQATQLLEKHGYGGATRGFAPEEQLHYEEPYVRADGVAVDLHRTLLGIGVSHEQAAQVLLSQHVEPFQLGQVQTKTFGAVARCLHLALHATAGGTGRDKAVEDLRRGLEVASTDTWLEALVLAEELNALAWVVAGLELLPAGRTLLAGLPPGRTVRSREAELRAADVPYSVLRLQALLAEPSWRGRFRLARTALLPTRAWLAATAPGAASTKQLRIRRLVSVARRLPGASAMLLQTAREASAQGRVDRSRAARRLE